MTFLGLAAAFGAGALLGCVYLAGLWATVSRLASSRHPLAVLAASTAIRVTLLLGAVVLVSGMQWAAMLAAVAGFTLVRIAATALAAPGRRPPAQAR